MSRMQLETHPTMLRPSRGAAHGRADTKRNAISTLREGVTAGALAATGVALWFFVVDLLAGTPLFTPARLGAALATTLGLQSVAQSATATAIDYTLFHYAAFVALGLAAVAVTHLARREPHVLAGALLTFVVAEVGFYSLVALLRETTLTGTLTWQQIAAGNLIGCYLLGARIWRAHPELRREFADALGANG
jgi:hypothetical protein